MFLKSFIFNMPYNFLLFPIFASCLIYIYLKLSNKKKFIIPSFFLLDKFETKQIQSKKLNIPLRFFYELFILFLFTLLLVDITFKNSDNRYLFFIDNSFSTKLKTNDKKTVFNILQKSAKDTLQTLPKNSVIKFISSDSLFKSKYLREDEGKNFIDTITTSYSKDNLENMEFDLSNLKKIFIFTDKDITKNDKNIIAFMPKIDRSVCNFAISNLNVISDTVNYGISSYCKKESKININISCNNKFNFSKSILLLPDNTIIEVQKIPQNKNITYCTIKISSKMDNLEEDNEAFFVMNNKGLKDVYLLSNPKIDVNNFIQLPFRIKDISYSELKNLKKDDIVIYNNIPIENLLDHQSIILPTSKSYFFKDRILEKQFITFKREGDPLVTYINPVNLILNSPMALNIDKKYYATDILKINDDVILSRIEDNNNAHILSGISLLPFKDSDLNTKIIFLNSIKFLMHNDIVSAYKTIPFFYTHKNEIKNIMIPSFYTINGQKEAFNFFDYFESNILVKNNLKLKIKNKLQKQEVNRQNEIRMFLIYIIILLILLEVIFFLIKRDNK